MSFKKDLEDSIRTSYNLIRQYEDIFRFSDEPREQGRTKHAIANQWKYIKDYLDDYIPLCKNLQLAIADDLREIIARFPEFNGIGKPEPERPQILQKEQKSTNKTIRILFLAANPKDTSSLRLDEEIRSIDLSLRQAEFRDMFDIKQHWALRVNDLQGYLLRHQPAIVHFSGHGSPSSEIILEDIYGNSQPVSPAALSQVFSVLKDNVRCIILNACYSEQQAQAIAQHIDCVIGMSKVIGDAAAISFAAAFYQALGFGRSVKIAFDLGCAQIDLKNLNEQNTPTLLAYKCDPASITFVNENT